MKILDVTPGSKLPHRVRVGTAELRVVRDGPRRYRLIGELDVATIPMLREAVAADVGVPPDELTLDLRELSFIDGAGARSFVLLHSALDGKLQLLFPTRQARRVIDLAGTDLNVLG